MQITSSCLRFILSAILYPSFILWNGKRTPKRPTSTL